MEIKELIEMLNEYKNENIVVEVDQPNPFQLVITLNR